MGEPENDLSKALSENGAFDADRAKEHRGKAVGAFAAAMRKTERYLRGYDCLFFWLVVFAMFHFMQSSTPKALLFYGMLVLVFFETIVLMKLWYWTMNTKISVLKAIKQLDLHGLTAGGSGAPRSTELEGPVKGLSRTERMLWRIALIAGVALIGGVKGAEVSGVDDPWSMERGGNLTSEACIKLAADGSGSAVTDISFVYEGTLARRGLGFVARKGTVVSFSDGRGRKLSSSTRSQKGDVHHTVALPRPIMPGCRFSYTRTEAGPSWANEEAGIWTYSSDRSYGYDTNAFSEAVVLPEGAEIVSVDPWPVAAFKLNAKLTVRFEGTRGFRDPFRYTIQYRLGTAASE